MKHLSNRPRHVLFSAIFALITSCFGLAHLLTYYAGATGMVDASKHFIGRDFVNLYFGGVLIDRGDLFILFSQPYYIHELQVWSGWEYAVHNWSYPPMRFWLAEFYALFSYPVAYAVWTVTGISALVFCARKFGVPWFWTLNLILSPAGLLTIWAGQNGFYSAAVISLAIWAGVQNRTAMAGFLWTCATLKPHLGLLVLPMLLLTRRYGIIAIGAVIFTAFVGVTSWRYGIDIWGNFLTNTVDQQRVVLENWTGLVYHLVPTSFMQLRLWGFDVTTSYTVHFAVSLISVFLLVQAWPRAKGGFRQMLTWFVLGTFLILPYSFFYDFLLFQLVLAVWARDPENLFVMRTRFLGMSHKVAAAFVFGLMWMLPLISFYISTTHLFQITPWVLLWLLSRFAKQK